MVCVHAEVCEVIYMYVYYNTVDIMSYSPVMKQHLRTG